MVTPNRPWATTYSGTATLNGDRTLWVSDMPGAPSKRCVEWHPTSGDALACAGWPATTASPTPFNFYEAVNDVRRPGCVWALGHAGQLVSFNRATGGVCGAGATTSIALADVKPQLYYCDGKPHAFAWGPVTISGLTPVTHYTGGTLTVYAAGGNTAIAGPVNFTAGSIPMPPLPPGSQTTGIVVKVELAFAPAGLTQINSGNGRVTVGWTADPPQICFTTTVGCSTSGTLTNVATATFGTATAATPATNVTSNSASVSVVNGPTCITPPTTVGCCPGYIAANDLLSMSNQYSAGGGNATEEIQTSGAPFTALVTGVQAQLALLRLSPTCSAATKIRLTFTHWSTNSAAVPTTFTTTTGFTNLGSFSIEVSAGGASGPLMNTLDSPPGTTKFVFPGSPNYYRIIASATLIDASGNPVTSCKDFDGTCFNSLRYADIHNPLNSVAARTSGPAAAKRGKY